MTTHTFLTVPVWLSGAFAAVVCCASAVPAYGQAAEPSVNQPATSSSTDSGIVRFFGQTAVTGFADAYYGWRFNKQDALLRNFDVDHNALSLNMVEIAFDKTPVADSRVGFRLDLTGGPASALVNALEPGKAGYLQTFQQAYVSYLAPVGSGLQIDAGKFVTPAGAETIETRDNWNYSRSFLFALAIPYYHMGVRTAYHVNAATTVSGYLVSGWNDVVDNNRSKSAGLSVGFKPNASWALTQTYFAGKEQAGDADGGVRQLFDTVVSFTATPKLSLLGNVDYGRDAVDGVDVAWYGIATYLKYQATDRWAFSPRYEWFSDADGFATSVEQRLQSVTLTGEYKMAGVITRLEWNTGWSGQRVFDNGGVNLKKTQSSLVLGALYAFSSK